MIDYGMGKTNIDHKTGIRYGVISLYDITQAWCDLAEPEYPSPDLAICPKCGEEYVCNNGQEWGDSFDCPNYDCGETFDIEFPDCMEAVGYTYQADGYSAGSCLDSDVIWTKSPYYTYCAYCSPCVPGAGDLGAPLPADEGIKAYCPGADWFDAGVPFDIYSVKTGKLVKGKDKVK